MAIGLVVILALVIFFLRSASDKSAETLSEIEKTPVEKAEETGGMPAEVKFNPPTKEEQTAGSIKAIATTFAERFGTFSNQADYISIEELRPLMTASLAKWVDEAYIPKLKKEHDPSGYYYQIQTTAPVANILEQNETAIKVRVSTQRAETIQDQTETQFIQDLILELKKFDNNWLVDGAYWQPKK